MVPIDSGRIVTPGGEISQAGSRLKTLDVLRGVAVLSVFCFHYLGAVFGIDQLPYSGNWLQFRHLPRPEFLFFWPLSFGWIGVPLFFVISGFCIHLSFLKQQQFSPARFYWKRLVRLYPAYVLVFLCSWALAFQRHEPRIWTQLFSHLFFLQNLFTNDIVFGINGALWSIATEIQFYLLYPLIVRFRRQMGVQRLLLCAMVVMVLGRLCLTSWQRALPQFAAAMATSPLLLIFDWMLGVSVADAWWKGECSWLSRKYLPGFFFGGLMISVLWRPASVFSFPLASLFFASMLGSLNLARPPISILGRGLRLIGFCSYSLYLVHQPLSAWLLQRSPIRGVAWEMTSGFVIVVGITWLGSQVIYHLAERPFWSGSAVRIGERVSN